MSNKWWTIFRYNTELHSVDVTHETEKYITYTNRYGSEVREMKETRYYRWFRTKKEAIEDMRSIIKKNLNAAKARVERMESEVDTFNKKFPKGA